MPAAHVYTQNKALQKQLAYCCRLWNVDPVTALIRADDEQDAEMVEHLREQRRLSDLVAEAEDFAERAPMERKRIEARMSSIASADIGEEARAAWIEHYESELMRIDSHPSVEEARQKVSRLGEEIDASVAASRASRSPPDQALQKNIMRFGYVAEYWAGLEHVLPAWAVPYDAGLEV